MAEQNEAESAQLWFAATNTQFNDHRHTIYLLVLITEGKTSKFYRFASPAKIKIDNILSPMIQVLANGNPLMRKNRISQSGNVQQWLGCARVCRAPLPFLIRSGGLFWSSLTFLFRKVPASVKPRCRLASFLSVFSALRSGGLMPGLWPFTARNADLHSLLLIAFSCETLETNQIFFFRLTNRLGSL